MERGRLKPGDPEVVGRMLYGMAFGSTQIRLLLGVRQLPSAEEIADLAREAVEVFLNGARAETVRLDRLSVAAG